MPKTNYSPTYPMYPGDAAAVTPSDSANLANGGVIYVGGTGNVRVTTSYGTDVVFTNVQGGTVLPVQVMKVWATNTTATGMVAIF